MIDSSEAVKLYDENYNYVVNYMGRIYTPKQWHRLMKDSEEKSIYVVYGYSQTHEYCDYIIVVARNPSHAMNLKKKSNTWEVATCYKVCDYIGIQFDNGTILEEHWVD